MRSPILDDRWPHPWIRGLCPQDGLSPAVPRPHSLPPSSGRSHFFEWTFLLQWRASLHPCAKPGPSLTQGHSPLFTAGHPGFRSPDSSAWRRVSGHPPSEKPDRDQPTKQMFSACSSQRKKWRGEGVQTLLIWSTLMSSTVKSIYFQS